MNITDALEPLTVPIDTIRRHPQNAKQHDLDGLRDGLRRYGQYAPIVANRRTSLIVAGNGLHEAAEGLGAEQIAVSWVDVDPTEELRLVAWDNRSQERAGYDQRAHADLLQSILDHDPTEGLLGTGYNDDDLTRLLQETGALGEQVGSFLDNLADGPASDPDDPTPRPGGYGPDGEPYFQLAYTVTGDQRELVLQALQQARKDAVVDTAAEALVYLAGQYLDRA